jgi:hypothetical protein
VIAAARAGGVTEAAAEYVEPIAAAAEAAASARTNA